MKTIKVSELEGAALDWAVAKCEGHVVQEEGAADIDLPKLFQYTGSRRFAVRLYADADYGVFSPSTDWAQGGPIIERERIELECLEEWRGQMNFISRPTYEDGPTPLIAAMRCYVASKTGDTVEVPEELL